MVNTEAFYRFHRFNESFDRNLKVTFGALEGLRTGVFPVTDGRTKLPIGDEPWRKLTSLADPVGAAESATRLTATMGIVRVSAALEDFLTMMEADYARTAITRHGATHGTTPPSLPRHWEGLKIPETCKRLGFDPAPLAFLMPLHDYFTTARNCIVHRNGRASAELVRIAQSPELHQAYAHWPTKRGAPVPALPTIKEGSDVPWLPRHAIFCLSVYYKAATLLNEEMGKLLGSAGFIYMAAHYALLDEDPIDPGARRSADVIIRTTLTSRYRHPRLPMAEIIQSLQAIGKWKACAAAFEAQSIARAKERKSRSADIKRGR